MVPSISTTAQLPKLDFWFPCTEICLFALTDLPFTLLWPPPPSSAEPSGVSHAISFRLFSFQSLFLLHYWMLKEPQVLQLKLQAKVWVSLSAILWEGNEAQEK